MLSARVVARSALPRIARPVRVPRTQQIRLQSSKPSSTSAGGSGATSHLAAGLAGGVAAAGILYGAYLFTPSGKTARAINKYSKEANRKYQEAAQKLQENTPDADQTVNYIREFCYSYVAWVPGGRQYVDAAFKDYDRVREKHRDEVDAIVNDAYKQFGQVAKSGLSLEAASKAVDVLADLSGKIAALAGDALDDILDNHPQLKEKYGWSINELKQLSDQYGPEAKEQVNKTWKQVREVLAGGLSAGNLDKARRLIEDKVEEVKRLGDEAWKKGLEQAKPYLDKSPKVKELLEKNKDALKQGNAKELFGRVKQAVESGDTGDLEGYVKKATDKAKSSKGSQLGLGQYFDMIPHGDEIMPKLKQLKEVAEKHSEEGQQLLKETMEELKKVLENKAQKAQKIADKAKKDAK